MTDASVSPSPEVSNHIPHDKLAERLLVNTMIYQVETFRLAGDGLVSAHFLDAEARAIFSDMVDKSDQDRDWLPHDFAPLLDRAGVELEPAGNYQALELRQRVLDAHFLRKSFLQAQSVATASLQGDVDKVTALLIEQDRAPLSVVGATWEGQGFDALDCIEAPRDRGWIVGGIIRDRTAIIIPGKGGSLKSMWVHAAGLSVAQGKDFVGLKTIQRPVLIISQDQGEEDYRERTHALMEYYGQPERGMFRIVTFPNPSLRLARDTSLLENLIEQYDTPPWVIIDSFLACAGVPSGNDDEAAEAMRAGCRLRDQQGITFTAIHHTPHNEKRGRGTAMIANTADYAIFAEVKNSVLQFTNEKPRSMPIDESVGFKFVYEHYHDSSIMRTCHFEWAQVDAPTLEQRAEGKATRQAKILKMIEGKPGVTSGPIKNGMGGNHQDTVDDLAELTEDGRVLVVKEGSSKHHFLPGHEHE